MITLLYKYDSRKKKVDAGWLGMMGGLTLFILTIDIVHVSDSGEVMLQYNNNITCIACIK